MRHLALHSRASRAPLEDLKDRPSQFLAGVAPRAHDPSQGEALIVAVAQVMRAMDVGLLSLENVPSSPPSISPASASSGGERDGEEGVYLEHGLALAA